MLTDVVNSIKAALYDRTSSPLFGAFALSWAGWNYRLAFVALSEGNYADKLIFISGILYRSWVDYAIYFFAAPLVTALLFIYLYPWPARKVYEFAASQQKKLREMRLQIEGDELISVEDARKLRLSHVELQLQFDAQAKRLKEERDALQELLNTAAKEKVEMRDRLTNLDAVTAERNKLMQELESLRIASRVSKRQEMVDAAQSDAIQRTRALMSVQKPSAEDLELTAWRLIYNESRPKETGSKLILLLPDGEIARGKNENENKWRLTPSGHLEFVQADGNVHSRFRFNPDGTNWQANRQPGLGMKTEHQTLLPAELSDLGELQ